MHSHLRFSAGMLVVPVAFLFLAVAYAGSVTIPNTFVAGTPSIAAQVNENFDAVAVAVNDNDARVTQLEGVNTIRVNEVPGDAVASGADLVSALGSAPAGTLVIVGPGTFDVGASTLVLPSGVDIRGAGRDLTVITSSTATTVASASGSTRRTLSFLTLESTNAASSSTVLSAFGNVLMKCARLRLNSPMGGVLVSAFNFNAVDSELIGRGHAAGSFVTGISTGTGTALADLRSCLIDINGDGSGTGSSNGTGDATTVLRDCRVVIVSTSGSARGVTAGTGDARGILHNCQIESATAVSVSTGSARVHAANCMLDGIVDFGISSSDIKLVGCYTAAFVAIADT